jgi:AmmeMemoRadiSam system protein B
LPSRPRLRLVETLVVPDQKFGKALILRDPEGVSEEVASIPGPLVPVVARFTGALTVEEIAEEARREDGLPITADFVAKLADELERALFLDSPRYRAERRRIEEEFARALVRPAAHAGGAYHADPHKLRRYIDDECFGRTHHTRTNGSVIGLIAPHIDPWRGREGYGHAYGLLRATLSTEVDTFVLLGTSHAPMREPFALCRKAFDTPLGRVEADLGAIDSIAERAPFDPYVDMFNHKREHSLEFQALFVRHVVGERPVRIIPILCGLGESQRTGGQPEKDASAETFLTAVRAVCDKRRGATVVVAGADMAHVGPRFGDPVPYGEREKRELENTDRASLELATSCAPQEFFAHVQRDLDTRRVCGLAPIYSLLRLLPRGARGELVHYEQTVDPEEGSIVSHAAVGFYG